MTAAVSWQLAGRDRGDRLQDLRRDLVRVALGVRAAVFEIALVVIVGEAVRHPDRGTTVCNAVGEAVDRLGLVMPGQAQMVVRAIDGDMVVLGSLEGHHE